MADEKFFLYVGPLFSRFSLSECAPPARVVPVVTCDSIGYLFPPDPWAEGFLSIESDVVQLMLNSGAMVEYPKVEWCGLSYRHFVRLSEQTP